MANQPAFAVRSIPASMNENGVASPPVSPSKDALSTSICAVIIVSGTSPFPIPAPAVMTWT